MEMNSAESLKDIEMLISQLDRQLQSSQKGCGKSPSTPVISKKEVPGRSLEPVLGAETRSRVERKVEDRLLQAGVVYLRKKNEHQLKTESEAADKSPLRRPETTRNSQKPVDSRLYKSSARQPQAKEDQSEISKEVKGNKRPKSPAPTQNEPKFVKVQLFADKRSRSVNGRNKGGVVEMKPSNGTAGSTGGVKVHREGDISERLLRYKHIYEEKRKELQMQKEKDLTFSPQINPRSRSPSPLRSKSPAHEEQPQFHPQLSKNSLKLAARLGSSTERLHSPTPQRTPREKDENCTFAPAVNPNSARLDNRKKVGENGSKIKRWEGLFEMVQVFKAKREELSKKYSRLEAEEDACTFHPQVTSPTHLTDPSHVSTRLVNWAKDREERLRQQRDEELTHETENCTFRPEVHPMVEEGSSPLRLNKGLDKFLERQEIARRLKTDKMEMLERYTGKKWTPKLTQPTSPKFHTRANTPNRSHRVQYLDLDL